MTNDDGVDAPGLAALQASVDEALTDCGLDADVLTVAPDRGRSECGHSVTNGRPLTLKLVRPNCYSLDGTPVDCVRVAMNTVMPNADLVLSGVNAGANLGVDLLVSGTFAAAREAASHGIPAMAISHYRHPDVAKTWDHVSRWTRETIAEFLMRERQSKAALWNLNLPAIAPFDANGVEVLPERVICEVDANAVPRSAVSTPCKPGAQSRIGDEFGVTFELDFHGRPRDRATDVDHCFAGKITLSKLGFSAA